MFKKKFVFFLMLFGWLLYSQYLQAQRDTTGIGNDRDSIVYVYGSPIVIQKTVNHKEEIFNRWFLDFFASSFLHSDAHRLCVECSEYKSEIKKSVKPVLGYGVGATIIYMPWKKHFIVSAGFSYSSFHENFTHQKDSTGIVHSKNSYNYLDLNIGAGYWFLRTRKISFIISGKIITSKLLASKGSTLDYYDFSKVLSTAEAKRDASWVIGGKLGLKAIFFNDKRMKFFIEPFTRGNFTSVLNYKDNYYLLRWANGIDIGLIYAL